MSNSHLQWGDIHTYFEVQLSAPGVTLHGGCGSAFRCCGSASPSTLGKWTQTTNNPAESDSVSPGVERQRYVLDGEVKPFETHTETIKVREPNGLLRDVLLEVRRSVHGPVVADRGGSPIAMRVAAID